MIGRIALCVLIALPVCAQHEKIERTVSLPTGWATTMVLVPAGFFPRGMEGEAFDEQPVRDVYLDEYLIDKYEVTVAQWGEYQRDTGALIPEWTLQNTVARQNHPITLVTWYDAAAFCQWGWQAIAHGSRVGACRALRRRPQVSLGRRPRCLSRQLLPKRRPV